MKHKIIFLFIAGLLLTGIAINSCKKDANTSIQTLFTTGTWQLASVKVTNYLGSSTVNTYYLDTACIQTQYFTFPNNTTCTFTNYHCITQTTTGSWSLTKDQLFLIVNMSARDTLKGGKDTTDNIPVFANTRIVNLGPYSMTLQTGDIGAYYTATTKRTIFEYAFVHRTTTK